METPEPGSKVKHPDQPGHQDRDARTSRAIKTETPGQAGRLLPTKVVAYCGLSWAASALVEAITG